MLTNSDNDAIEILTGPLAGIKPLFFIFNMISFVDPETSSVEKLYPSKIKSLSTQYLLD